MPTLVHRVLHVLHFQLTDLGALQETAEERNQHPEPTQATPIVSNSL